MQAQIDQIRQKVQDCIRIAEQKFGITMPAVEVLFNLTGRAAGMAVRQAGLYSLRFNRNHIALGGKTYEHLLNDTVPHEVAHTVCQAFPQFGRNHDRGWQRVCIALGGNGQTRYSEEDAPEAVAHARPWVYITTAGHQVRVTKIIHAKIQRGVSYMFRGGLGRVTQDCQYSYMSAPTVQQTREPAEVTAPQEKSAVAATVKTAKPAATQPGESKAAVSRRIMLSGYQSGRSYEEIIAAMIAANGYDRALARGTFKANAARVGIPDSFR